MLKATANLCSIEGDPFVVEPGIAHIIDVELQVSAIHDGEDQAEGILGLVGIGQANLWTETELKVTEWYLGPDFWC